MARFPTSRESRNEREDDRDWKSLGFLNLSLPSKRSKSGYAQLKGIPLLDKEFVEWIEKDPEAACAAILANAKLTYQSATPQAGSKFDFDALKPTGTGSSS